MEREQGIFSERDTVGEIVAQSPGLSCVFEHEKIDYCCGGKKSLNEACEEKDIDIEEFLEKLKEANLANNTKSDVDVATMPLSELVDHIVQTHHTYLRAELPRLTEMIDKVSSVHGDKDSRLGDVRNIFAALNQELSSHMMKEEQILFPMIRNLESGQGSSGSHCGGIENPIRQMEHEHDQAGEALKKLRELTDDYSSPEWACNTCRAMLDALAYLEQDLHQHIHKENNVLFPRSCEMQNLS